MRFAESLLILQQLLTFHLIESMRVEFELMGGLIGQESKVDQRLSQIYHDHNGSESV